jgi:hypothetical protein
MMLSRTEAADKIAEAIEAGGYSASAWAPEGSRGPVRVYVTIPAASWKKKARKIGYVAVELDGTLTSELDVQSGTIMGFVPALEIAPAMLTPKASPAATQATGCESADQLQQSAAAVAAQESVREIG